MGLKLDALVVRNGSFEINAALSLHAGFSCALIGPSGCGKSTILSAIAGFLTPLSGRIQIDGTDITTCLPGLRPLSILFQDHNLFPHMTVEQNIGLGIRPNLRLTPQDKQAIEEILERIGLAGMGARKPAALSGGQQSRVALARALLRRRRVLLLDEPFAALGPSLRAEMMTLALDMTKEAGTTTLIVTHDPKDAYLCDVAAFVDKGRLQQPQAAQELLARPTGALREYLG